MSLKMDEATLIRQEALNSGTTKTNNEFFEKHGYLVLKNLCDPNILKSEVPDKKGIFHYWGKNLDQFNYVPLENQVEGSASRYWHPQYRKTHSDVRLQLEKVLGKPLYNTYYYDRFYFPGQRLNKHLDRDACEISVTVHIGTNLNKKDKNWPIWIKTVDGKNESLILNPGDGMVYKGCERPHWREPMPGSKKLLWFQKEQYYHQIFFHYVLQNGQRSHCAFDAAR